MPRIQTSRVAYTALLGERLERHVRIHEGHGVRQQMEVRQVLCCEIRAYVQRDLLAALNGLLYLLDLG